MMVALRKVFGDLRQGWGRVLLLFAVVLVGQSAMTAAFMALIVVGREIDRNFAMGLPGHAFVEAVAVDMANLGELDSIDGVEQIEMMAKAVARYRLPDGSWRSIVLFGRRDFEDLRVARLFLESGAWPRRDQVLIERSGMSLLETDVSGMLEISFARGRNGVFALAGTVHDPAQAPSWQEDMLYGYVDLQTLERLAGPLTMQFQIRLAPGASPGAVTRELARRLSAQGAEIVRVDINATRHPHSDLMEGLLLLLAVFSGLSFIIALFLSGAIVAALAQKQQRQLAVLRAMGASRLRIALMHFCFVMTPAAAGLIGGALLGEFGAGILERAIAWQLNIDITGASVARIIRDALLFVSAGGLTMAMAVPIVSALGKPVREALQNAPAQGGLPGLRLSMLSPLDQMSVAEAFRRPVRTSITVVALTVAGVALLTSTNTFVSLVGVVDRLLESRSEDISTTMMNPPDLEILESRIRQIDGLVDFELWDAKTVDLSARNAPGQLITMFNPPTDTVMGLPAVVEGRWPTNMKEVAISRLSIGPDAQTRLALGEIVSLRAGAGSIKVEIVGLIDDFSTSLWTNEATFALLAEPSDRARQIRATADHRRLGAVSAAVEQAVLASGSFPAATVTREARRSQMVNHFLSFYQFLLVASLTAAVVGGAALSATIGSNVLERTREIGVLRTIGATSNAVFRLVLGQALSLSLVSLVVAVVLSIPISYYVVDLMEQRALHMYMPLEVSWIALASCAAGALLIATMAALAPALRIWGLPIRETIAHE